MEIYSGVPQQRNEVAGFFQPPAQTSDGLLATEQARAVAEVQAALVIAASRPRNELRARDRLLQACQRVKLASGAIYQYTRGGSSVSGPSIRLAEAAARAWGNMTYGFRELTRRSGESECEAYAWDLETNTKAVRQFTVRHRRDTRKGGYDLTDERDIYELMANQAQRRVRAAILEIIPGDIMEDAVYECEKTQKAHVGNIPEATAKLVEAFANFGITREAIEERLGHRLDAIQPAQIIAFRKIYTSIKDGMSDAKDWFNIRPAQAEPEPAADEKAKKNGNGKSKPKNKPDNAAQNNQPEPQAQVANNEQAVMRAQEPETPSRNEPASDSFMTTPFHCFKRNETVVGIEACPNCPDKNDCAQSRD